MPVPAELRQQVEVAIQARPEVTPRNMMGTTAYMVRRRMFAFWTADGLVAKLPAHARQEFLDRRQGVLFQGPQGRGFGEWTRLELSKEADLEHVLLGAKHAYEYVRGAAEKTSRSKARKRGRGK